MSPDEAAWGGESRTRRLNVSSCPPHLVEGGPLGGKDLISGGGSVSLSVKREQSQLLENSVSIKCPRSAPSNISKVGLHDTSLICN